MIANGSTTTVTALWLVLIVDDSAEDRAEIRRMLPLGAERRYRFREVGTGLEALRAIRESPDGHPDCLVLDYHLPDIDAIDVIESILGPDGLPICPVVVITGEDGLEMGRAVLRAGAQDYVGKAWLTPAAMTRAVENAVERHALARQLAVQAAAVRESEERLRLALEAAETGLMTWDLVSDEVAWSPECDSTLAGGGAELGSTGAGFIRMVHPEDRARMEEALRAAVEGRTPYECDFQLIRPDGEVRWVANRGRATYDRAGRPLRMLGTVTDITARKRAEARTLENDERLRAALRAGSAVGSSWDVEGDRVVRFHSSEPALPQNEDAPARLADVRAVVHPEDRGRFDRAIAGCLAGADAYRSEYRVVRADGSVRWLEEDGTLSRDDLGRPLRLTAIARDVTEQKEADASLREREVRLRLALDAAQAGMWEYEPSTGEFVLTDRAGSLHGMPDVGRLDRESALRAIHPDDRGTVIEALENAIEAGSPFSVEVRAIGPDGSIRWLAFRGERIADRGAPRLLGVVRDITPGREAVDALRARERELQALADNSQDLLARFDRDLRHVYVNAAFARAAGLPREEFFGRTSRELGRPAGACDLWDEALLAAFDTGEPRTIEFGSRSPEGERFYASRLVPEIGPEGGVTTVLCVARDVTDRRRHQEAFQEQDRRKNDFLATLAHELRNPLAPIQSGLELLRAGPDLAEAAETREMMGRQLSHLVRLVDDLLDVSRIARGNIKLQRGVVEVREVLDLAVEAARPAIESAGHTLTVLPPRDPAWVDGDLTRLAQTVGNLLNNAAKYTPSSGRIEMSARVEGGSVAIRVTDSGVGIAADMLAEVFDLLTQADRTLDRPGGGLGIGLSLVKKLVELHGGSIEAESPGPGGGSTFTVRLPLSPPPLTMDGARPAGSRAAAAAAGRPICILVVHDNEATARGLAMFLQVLGLSTITALSGPAALGAAREFRPDFVFLDLDVAGIDAHEVCRRLKADPSASGATVVALTGRDTDDDWRPSPESGFSFRLVKPLGPNRVLEALAAADAGRRPSP
ncbi:Autoinducer 2 sensor kinase/phosphatase LuxQ [Aquisphaera giovannonii]|uniref:histidine kinase n=1 Tax=Aquisphaera giovannonii TaxID=406548 RepID=A0A5B9W8N3_9BACT|nr:PAS domain-containing protein [Aquisphaera giovannonii]QEH36737.1 Autoinducer 2 sensor kinase/phosphatase LuxQ [Aquisphaera giovannonii]